MDLLTCQRLASPPAYPEHEYTSLTLMPLQDLLLHGSFTHQSPLLGKDWKWTQVNTFMTADDKLNIV